MKLNAFKKVSGVLSAAMLFCIAFIPSVETLPKIRAEDFLVPVGLAILIIGRKRIPRARGSFQWGLVFLVLTSFCSLAINQHLFNFSDSVELYKFVKLYLFSAFAFYGAQHLRSYLKYLWIFIMVLLVANAFQYLDLFGFNDTIVPLYTEEDQLMGLMEGTDNNRRLVGLMGNPNDNAAFWFLAIVLLASSATKYKVPLIIMAALCIVCTQSRGMITGSVLCALFCFFRLNLGLKKKIYILAAACLFVTAVVAFLLPFLPYITIGFSSDVADSGSYMLRLEIWNKLLDLAYQRPLLGYGGNKSYFYENKIYAEDEFILYFYRWGAIGLIGYCALYWDGIKSLLARQKNINWLGLASLGLLLAACFNAPMNEPRISVFFAVLMGLLLESRVGSPGLASTAHPGGLQPARHAAT